MSYNQNVIPIKKIDKFALCRGTMGPDDELIEYEQVGLAYLKPGSKTFRIKLWMLPKEQYFLSPIDDRSVSYTILSLEEFQTLQNEKKASWQKVGKAELVGLHIKLNFSLLNEDIYLCLFPDESQAEEFYAVG